jgi:hypothetical protein
MRFENNATVQCSIVSLKWFGEHCPFCLPGGCGFVGVEGHYV